MLFTALGLFVGPVIPASWNIAFAAPVLFTALLVTAIDRWEKAAVAALSAALTVFFSGLPNRSGLLIAALLGVLLGVLLERRRSGA